MLSDEVFNYGIDLIEQNWGHQLPDAIKAIWREYLNNNLNDAAFAAACNQAIIRLHRMPTPEQLAEFGGGGKTKILDYWERIEKNRKRFNLPPGATELYDDLMLSLGLNSVALKALKSLGGLTTLCEVADQDMRFIREKFIEYYQLWECQSDRLHEEAEEIRQLQLKAQSKALALPPAQGEPIPESVLEKMAQLFPAMPKPEPVLVGTSEDYRAIAQAEIARWKAQGLLHPPSQNPPQTPGTQEADS